MPYNAITGIYTLPAIYLAVAGTTIIAAQHNTPLEDLATANNYARPIVAGGTAASTLLGAQASLGIGQVLGLTAVAVAGTMDISATDASVIQNSGGGAMTAISTKAAGKIIWLECVGAFTIVHNATNLILPGAANITTAAGDVVCFLSDGAGNWRCISYLIAANLPLTVGTFTPLVAINGSSTGVTYGVNTGNYIKTGKFVHFEILIDLTNNGANTGAAVVTGLPFQAANSVTCLVYAISGFTGLTAGAIGYINNSTTIQLFGPSTTGAAVLTDTNVTNTAFFAITGTYIATS